MAKTIKKTVTTTVTEEVITTNELTHIIAILDTSGSMSSIIIESINAFNGFLKTQRELSDECTITINLFDDQFETLVDYKNIKEVKDITKNQWIPRGLTALYDGINKSIAQAKSSFVKLGDNKPSKVLVCIVTDGQENASKECKSSDIKKLIKNCEDNENWNFVFLASNQDAFISGSQIGMSFGNTYTYAATACGVNDVMNIISASATSYRSMSSADPNFKRKSKTLVNDQPNIGTTVTDNNGTTGNIGTITNPTIMGTSSADTLITTNVGDVTTDADGLTFKNSDVKYTYTVKN